MTDVNTPPPAGWYPDPAGSSRTRWWNGFGWSDTFGDPVAATTPGAAPGAGTTDTGTTDTAAPATFSAYAAAPAYTNAPAYSLEQPTAPAGTPPYTPFIWALAVLPIVGIIDSIITLAMFDQVVTQAFAPDAPPFAPGDLLRLGISWLVIGASVLLGILDWRALNTAGVPKPFHWAWNFFAVIGVPVYMVGRSIVVRRRLGGGGLAPMIVNLSLIVVGFALGVVGAVLAVGSVFDSGLLY